eukprot:2652129-Pyramimonas_sp.AAC.1
MLCNALNATLRHVVADVLRPACYAIKGFWKRCVLHYTTQCSAVQTCCDSLGVTLLCHATISNTIIRTAYE